MTGKPVDKDLLTGYIAYLLPASSAKTYWLQLAQTLNGFNWLQAAEILQRCIPIMYAEVLRSTKIMFYRPK